MKDSCIHRNIPAPGGILRAREEVPAPGAKVMLPADPTPGVRPPAWPMLPADPMPSAVELREEELKEVEPKVETPGRA